MSVDKWLEQKLGLKGQTYKVNLSKKELFHEAIANDRGRVELDGPDNQKRPSRLNLETRDRWSF